MSLEVQTVECFCVPQHHKLWLQMTQSTQDGSTHIIQLLSISSPQWGSSDVSAIFISSVAFEKTAFSLFNLRVNCCCLRGGTTLSLFMFTQSLSAPCNSPSTACVKPLQLLDKWRILFWSLVGTLRKKGAGLPEGIFWNRTVKSSMKAGGFVQDSLNKVMPLYLQREKLEALAGCPTTAEPRRQNDAWRWTEAVNGSKTEMRSGMVSSSAPMSHPDPPGGNVQARTWRDCTDATAPGRVD